MGQVYSWPLCANECEFLTHAHDRTLDFIARALPKVDAGRFVTTSVGVWWNLAMISLPSL